MKTAISISIALLAFATACGGDDKVKEAGGDTSVPVAGQSPGSSPSSTEAGSLEMDDVVAYFEDQNTGEIDDYGKALAAAAPGSLAYAYTFHQQQLDQAYLDEGSEIESGKVTEDDGVVTVCVGEAKDEECYKYADIEAKDGKVASFTVDGRKLNDRISLGDGVAVSAGPYGSVRFLSAYKSAGNDLFVVIEVKTKKEKAQFQAYEATYRSPSGRQAKASAGTSDFVIPDSTTNQALIFPNAQPGGVVTMEVVDEDYSNPKTVVIKTR